MSCSKSKPQELCLYQGESKTLKLSIRDTANKAVDITSYEVNMTVRKTISSNETVLTRSTTVPAEAEITDAAAGIVKIYLLSALTATLSVGTYVYDIWVTTDTGEDKIVIPPSPLVITQPVTR